MDNAFSIYQSIIDGGYTGIKSMIGSREENLFLDFKQKADQHRAGVQNGDKKLFAKALSGFSNSAGGVIIWGVNARKVEENSADVAIEEKPIKTLRTFLTDLNNLINEAIVPLNTGIVNQAIYLNDNQVCDEGFIITYVPESDLTPHRAMLGDNLYYTRAGDSFVKMEHHMLEDSFGRRQKPKLKLLFTFTDCKDQNDGYISYKIALAIQNIGKYIATFPALKIKICRELSVSKGGVDGDNNWNLKPTFQTQNHGKIDGYLFVGGINNVIHPGTFIEVVKLEPNEEWRRLVSIFKLPDTERFLSFNYEMYAEGCAVTFGDEKITGGHINKLYREMISVM